MQGFDSEFKDLTDYILKITHRIWEGRGVDRIRDWYGKTAPVYTPTSFSASAEDVIKFTLQTLHMFPDRQLFGEAVIGAEPEPGLFYSSHRILSTMTHKGDGVFGKPSGRLVKTRIIADCICQNNQVVWEWMVRDQSAIIKDIGLNIETFGRAQGRALQQAGWDFGPERLIKNWTGTPAPKAKTPAIEMIADSMQAVWQDSAIRMVDETYDRAATSYVPGGQTLNGIDEIKHFLAQWKASMPQANLILHHWHQASTVENEPIQIALRWSLSGEHSGHGHFGAPSGAPLTILGISHFELKQGKIYRDYHLIDELSIWGQIEAHQQA